MQQKSNEFFYLYTLSIAWLISGGAYVSGERGCGSIFYNVLFPTRVWVHLEHLERFLCCVCVWCVYVCGVYVSLRIACEKQILVILLPFFRLENNSTECVVIFVEHFWIFVYCVCCATFNTGEKEFIRTGQPVVGRWSMRNWEEGARTSGL